MSSQVHTKHKSINIKIIFANDEKNSDGLYVLGQRHCGGMLIEELPRNNKK